MNHFERIDDWKLYRAVYDYMGIRAIEGERPTEEFEELRVSYDEAWIIGYKPSTDHTTICVILEGNKEILEYVLELVKSRNDIVI